MFYTCLVSVFFMLTEVASTTTHPLFFLIVSTYSGSLNLFGSVWITLILFRALLFDKLGNLLAIPIIFIHIM